MAYRSLPRKCDFAVVGGGVAGAVLARELARAGANAVLFERTNYSKNRVGESLPPTVLPLLAAHDLSAVLEKTDALPSPGLRIVWGSEAPYDYDFLRFPQGIGWHIERKRFDAALSDAAVAAGALVLRDATVRCARPSSSGIELTFTAKGQQECLICRTVVDATGRHSAIARQFGSKRATGCALVAVIQRMQSRTSAERADRRLHIEALEMGWSYFSPLPGGSAIAVLLTLPMLIRQFGVGNLWQSALDGSRLIAPLLRLYQPTGGVSFSLANGTLLFPVAGPNWIAVGDAACTFDPLSSLGISHAIESAVAAAEILLAAPDIPENANWEYGSRLLQRYSEYEETRRAYYMREKRWSQSPFWMAQRRSPALPA